MRPQARQTKVACIRLSDERVGRAYARCEYRAWKSHVPAKKFRGQIDKKDKQFEHNSLKETVKEQKIEEAISIYERTAAPVPALVF